MGGPAPAPATDFSADASAPDLLVIGAATRDLVAGGGWRLGGTVVFAALTAVRLGLRAAIVTSGPPDVLAALAAAAPEVAVAAVPASEATTFENVYDASGHRQQYLRGQAAPLTLAAVPTAWRAARWVLLAPLAHEVDPDLAAALRQDNAPDDAQGERTRVAATPQGWLRRWDTAGLVRVGAWDDAARVLPALAALILSWEDLCPPDAPRAGDGAHAAEEQLRAWSAVVPQVVVTRGAEGADLLTYAGRERFPAYPARQVDPTGAGDVFAAAFLCRLLQDSDPRRAMDYANCAASFAVEREGTAGIPTRAQVERRRRAGR